MVSIWYTHPRLYDFGMSIIHGKNYTKRYVLIAEIIQPNSSVLDIGCGSCLLQRYIEDKNVHYEGWDLNPFFVKNTQKKGGLILLKNATKATIPEKDYIVISDVLHHIAKKDKGLVKECLKKIKKALIIVEPFTDSKEVGRKAHGFLRKIRRKISFIEKIIGENDGVNNPHDILIKTQNDLIKYFDMFGINTKKVIGGELVVIYENERYREINKTK